MSSKSPTLYSALVQLKTDDEAKRFITDLCTPSEIQDLEQRWTIAQLLDEGRLSYREIAQKTGASVTTVGRVFRFLTQEKYQGYRTILDRICKSSE